MKYKWIALSMISVFFLTQCTTLKRKKPPQSATPKASTQFKIAIKSLKKKKYKISLRLFKNFVDEHPESDLTDDAYIYIGDIYYNKKNYASAANAYLAIIKSQFFSPKEKYASFKAALCLQKLGQLNEALSLSEAPASSKNQNYKLRIKSLKLRQQLLSQLGDQKDLIKTLLTLSQVDNDESQKINYKNEIKTVVEGTNENSLLKSYLSLDIDDETRAFVYFKLAEKSYKNGNFSKAESSYENVINLFPNSKISEKSTQKIKQIRSRNRVDPYTIGVILPLEGQHSAIAQRALNSLKLGLGIYGDNPSEFQVAILSSQNNLDSAQKATERLILEDNVIAIVGSLLSRTSEAVAKTSNLLGVPNISLSQKSNLTEVGPFVFRNSITSKMMIKELVHTAIHKKNIRKVAILYPNDNYGIEYANLFWDEVVLNGGEVVGAQIYKSGETDFNAQLHRLFGTFYIEDRLGEYKQHLRDWMSKQKRINSRTVPPKDLLPPIKDFDALFIPDNTKTLGQIAPSLPYHDVSDVVLLGTNLWHTPSLIKRGGQQVENSLFVDGLLKKDESFKKSDFYLTYRKTFNEEPGLLEAQAFDTGLILRQLILNGSKTRIDLVEKLSQLNHFPASFGRLYMSESREITRPIHSFTVNKGSIEIIKD